MLGKYFQLFIVRKHLFLKSPLAPLCQRGGMLVFALFQRGIINSHICMRFLPTRLGEDPLIITIDLSGKSDSVECDQTKEDEDENQNNRLFYVG